VLSHLGATAAGRKTQLHSARVCLFAQQILIKVVFQSVTTTQTHKALIKLCSAFQQLKCGVAIKLVLLYNIFDIESRQKMVNRLLRRNISERFWSNLISRSKFIFIGIDWEIFIIIISMFLHYMLFRIAQIN